MLVRSLGGAPEEIRTPDPQIRSLWVDGFNQLFSIPCNSFSLAE
jgi:hypothetical protein